MFRITKDSDSRVGLIGDGLTFARSSYFCARILGFKQPENTEVTDIHKSFDHTPAPWRHKALKSGTNLTHSCQIEKYFGIKSYRSVCPNKPLWIWSIVREKKGRSFIHTGVSLGLEQVLQIKVNLMTLLGCKRMPLRQPQRSVLK